MNLPTFSAFKSRNYRLYFYGQSVSLIGTWNQRTAVSWVVYTLTHSPLMLGLTLFAGQLDVILRSVATVGEVAADDIPPTSHAVPLVNVFRQDVVRPGLTQQQALAAAPAAEDGRFRVPRILGEE